MIKPSTKIKKGTKYIVIETGDEVTFDNVTFDGLHLVNYPNGNWHAFEPDELKPATKQRTPISNKPKQLTEAKQSDKDKLNAFFDEQAKTMPFNCDECNKPLYAYTRFAKRCVSAHIFPKSEFKSIATNPLNIFYLGADLLGICSHHDTWDKCGVSNRQIMKVYSLAVERLEMMKAIMPQDEILKAYKYLGIPVTTDILNQLK